LWILRHSTAHINSICSDCGEKTARIRPSFVGISKISHTEVEVHSPKNMAMKFEHIDTGAVVSEHGTNVSMVIYEDMSSNEII
jgi:hypothetical protein